ncbi:TetR/AcrR family transcriptional regulator [Streptomyces shenzhenensis]|uniref:TetR/AcrR family transcriptional regulator n=1 Tax=Streptomyces TaxID=1883 RepID=UPI001F381C51|nr:TetR/AcrR family transcriptional regulator [Streptomyces shenzhenensis]
MTDSQPGLRERTRRAVQKEITDAANALFLERGYEETTIGDIAAAVGMSQRSVFRYFPTKEDLVVGKFDFVADDMLQALRERPAGEPVWESMRRIFDLLVPYVDAPGRRQVAEPMQRIVFSTPTLLASYLQKLQLLQDTADTALRERAAAAGVPYHDSDPTPRAIVGAAFACLLAAQHAWLAGGAEGTFATAIDRAMATITPRSGNGAC